MGHANRQSYRGIKSCRMLWFRNGLRYLRILACPATGTRPSSGHGPNNRDLKHRAGIRSILTSGWLRRVSSLYPYHAQCTNSCPENDAHTAAQCQCQSSGARNSKDLCNEHISNFIGFEVTRVESAYEVDHLGQPFYDKSVAYCDSCPHKPQNDIILQHSNACQSQLSMSVAQNDAGASLRKVSKLSSAESMMRCFLLTQAFS